MFLVLGNPEERYFKKKWEARDPLRGELEAGDKHLQAYCRKLA